MVWYGMVWYGMVWYGMAWYGMAWHGMAWYGMVWHGMAWYGMVYGMVWYGMVWYGIWYGMVWYGMVYGMVWYGILYGMVWYGILYGMVWYGIWYGTIQKVSQTFCPCAMCRKTQGDIQQLSRNRFCSAQSGQYMPCIYASSKGCFFSDVKGEIAHILINTVDKNKNKYTVKQCSDAHKARLIQDIIDRPSTTDYINYIENYLILNCPITKDDIVCAEDILGPNLGSLKQKMKRKTQRG